MTADQLRDHLRPFVDAQSTDLDDSRVQAVLAVVAGEAVAEVASEYGIDATLLRRWVRSFLDAGSRQIVNRPTENAAEGRDRFLGAFAHETRTPLTAAKGWAEMLRDGSVPADRVDDVQDRLIAALDRLAERNLDVEMVAASSLGRLDLALRAVTVRELIEGLDIAAIGGEGGDVEIFADPRYLSIVLRDLWQAAHTPPIPVRVQLDIALVDRWVELRMIRIAEPIDPAVLQALFDPFDLNDGATGVTIGLYLARALTVAHGGTIGVDQDESGAVLWVRIPSPAPVIATD